MAEHSTYHHNLPPPPPEEAPALPLRNEGFESFAATKLNDIMRKLDAIFHTMQGSNAALDRNLPIVFRQIIQEELKENTPTPQPTMFRSGDGNRFREAREQISSLEQRNAALEKQVQQQQRQVGHLTLDLSKKATEARKLHDIIHQNAQATTETSDEEITKRFGDLYYGIVRIVNKRFPHVEARVYAKDLATLTKEDKVLMVRSRLANSMYLDFFHPDAMTFGFSQEEEKAQQRLEAKLVKSDVSQSDIDEWRIKTIKVSRALQQKGRLYQAEDLADDLCERNRDIGNAKDKEEIAATQAEMAVLCGKAFELALILRESTAKFEWGQGERPSEIPLTDADFINDFNAKAKSGASKPVKILFGPLWKIVDGERILERKGEVLSGGGPESYPRKATSR